jgi:phosphatidylglycerophosphate synthase
MTDFLHRVREFHARYRGPQGLFFIRLVNHPLGSVLGVLLSPTRVSPNMVTVAGLIAHLAGAAVVVALPAPAPLLGALAVMLLWQLAFSLDCADGQLARARGAASSFGAWFDQLVDVLSHSAVYAALAVFLARALQLDAAFAAGAATLAVAASLLQVFSTWQRGALIGGGPPGGAAGGVGRRLLYGFRHLLDYGAFVFVAALLLTWPIALASFLAAMAGVHLLYVAAQLALEWRRSAIDAAGRPPAGTA